VGANRTLVVDADPERRGRAERLLRESGFDGVSAAADLASAMLETLHGDARIPGSPAAQRPTLAKLERRYAREVLAAMGGNKTRAAEILGIDRKTLYRLLGTPDGRPGPQPDP
jgi:transcriptional regulator of acetoin/glycerol metabolism